MLTHEENLLLCLVVDALTDPDVQVAGGGEQLRVARDPLEALVHLVVDGPQRVLEPPRQRRRAEALRHPPGPGRDQGTGGRL